MMKVKASDVAEIGASVLELGREVERLRAELTRVTTERDAMEQRKDDVYLERNQCVALIARMAIALGYWAGTAKTAIEGWSEDWHGCVYIDLPTGQVSWHYHDSQAHLFGWLPPYCAEWDGHDTPEKYRRVLDRKSLPNIRADRLEAEFAEARRDVERYRWLRGQQDQMVVGTNPGSMDYGMSAVVGTYDEWLTGDEMDEAIDAAMEADRD